MKFSKLKEDLSKFPRITDDVIDCFSRYNFYYIENLKTTRLQKQQTWDKKALPPKMNIEYYYNVDYRLLEYYGKNHDANLFCNFLFYLVTSIDQNGIISPINSKNLTSFHPGTKRVAVASYLGIKTVPVLLQTKQVYESPNYEHIDTLEKLHKLYKNDCSFKHRRNDDYLEIAWHGASNRRDNLGYDNWFKKAEEVRQLNCDINIPTYLLENGLEVITPTKKESKIDGKFKTFYNNQRTSPISIVIEDPLYEDLDPWELFFHIDPSISKKIDKTKKITIYNDFAKNQNILENCRLLSTLKRKKFFTRQFLENKGRYINLTE